MKQHGYYDEQQSRGYILQLMDTTPTAANVKEYVAIVKDKALLRRTVPWALVTAAAASWAATALDVTLLRRPFGIFLLIAAAVTLRRK